MTKTKYVFIADDDHIFTQNTNLSKLLSILEWTDIDIVGVTLIPDSYFNGILHSLQVRTFQIESIELKHLLTSIPKWLFAISEWYLYISLHILWICSLSQLLLYGKHYWQYLSGK